MSENDGDLITFRHDKRITKIGKILRMTKIDENSSIAKYIKRRYEIYWPKT